MTLDIGEDNVYVLAIYCAETRPLLGRPGDVMFYITRKVDGPSEVVGKDIRYNWALEGRLRTYYDDKSFDSDDTKQWISFEVDKLPERQALEIFRRLCRGVTEAYNHQPMDRVKYEEYLIRASGHEAAQKFAGYSENSDFMHMKVMTPEQALAEGYINQAEYDRKMKK